MQMLNRLALVAIFAGAVLAGAGPAMAGGLASHRALYDLKLLRSKTDATVTSVVGRLIVEWQDTCDGYTTNQRFYSQFGDNEGRALVSDLWVSSWEAPDGGVFRFNLTNMINGVVEERSRGLARRAPNPEVTFEEPKPDKQALPSGAIFPTAHTQALIEAAKRGEHVLERTVFDGGADKGLSFVGAFIGKEVQAKPVAIEGTKSATALTGGRSWPVRLAFFPHGRGDDVPDYEMAFLMNENGVATRLQYDYGDFVMAADLRKIESLPGCAAKKPAQ